MDTNLYLNPKGRIGPAQFWRGIVLLLIVSLVISALQLFVLGNQGIASKLLGALNMALIYPLFCLYSKRLHDNGKSAWLFLLVILWLFIISIFIVVPGMKEAMHNPDLMEAAKSGDKGPMTAWALAYAKAHYMRSLGFSLLEWLVPAFLVSRLKSDPEENHFGPATR